MSRSTYVSRSHFFSRILLLFIGFVPIWCTSRAFTIGIYTVKLGNAWDQKKSDFSGHRLSRRGLLLLQSLQGRTQNDRGLWQFHYVHPQSNPRCLYIFFPFLFCLRHHNSRFSLQLSAAGPFKDARNFGGYHFFKNLHDKNHYRKSTGRRDW